MTTEHEIELDLGMYPPAWGRDLLGFVEAGNIGEVDRMLRAELLLPYESAHVVELKMADRGDAESDLLFFGLKIEHGPIFREKDVEVPEWVASWRDDSWGNDAVAFTSKAIGQTALVLLVDSFRDEDRECGGERYALQTYRVVDGDDYDYNDEHEDLYDGSDPVACKKACAVAEGELREAWLADIAKTRRPTEAETNLALEAYARAADMTEVTP